jgi:hypothetical protein
MILGFHPQFVLKIKNGTKIHTIRQDKKNRWHDGMKIHFATGVRSKRYVQFQSGKCKSTQIIIIKHRKGDFPQKGIWIDGVLRFSINGVLHNGTEFMTTLALNDGFKNYDDFFDWFDKDFEGKIIHWTDFRY